MRCITLTQPYATLVAIGAKQIETRSWSTTYRGPLAIHAAKGLGPVGGKKGLTYQCAKKYFLPALDVIMPEHLRGIGSPGSIAERLPLGAIVAVCELKAIARIDYYQSHPDDIAALDWEGPFLNFGVTGESLPDEPELSFGDYTLGRYAWLLADVKMLAEPIPCKGALGLWEPDVLTQMAIKRQEIAQL